MVFLSTLNRLIHSISGILLGIMTMLVLLQILFRYILELPFTSSEELARFIMVWLVMLAATVVLRNKSHIAVEYFAELCSERVQKIARIISHLFILIFCIILVIYGFELSMIAMKQIAPATQIPTGWIVLSIPVCGFISMLYTIEHIIEELFPKKAEAIIDKGAI
jgi:TRAP-type C4-dicarboxylate transport system permease small subunit